MTRTMPRMLLPLARYADFRGRSVRSEYWLFVLFLAIGFWIALWLDTLLRTGGDRWSDLVTGPGVWSYASYSSGGWLTGLFALAMLVPALAVTVRRLHDIGRSGAWLLLVLLPFAGPFVLFVFMLTDGQRGPNRYGDDPKPPG